MSAFEALGQLVTDLENHLTAAETAVANLLERHKTGIDPVAAEALVGRVTEVNSKLANIASADPGPVGPAPEPPPA